MRPDLQIFNSHVGEAAFQIGNEEGRWGILDDSVERPAWPFVIIWIGAASKNEWPDKQYLKFNLENYPEQAPTACPWDIAKNERLANDKWPRGVNEVSKVFNPEWNGGVALYAPCDRIAMIGHEAWKAKHLHLWWQSSFKITVYLKFVHYLLNTKDYVNS
ncbi:MAG: hypothetical protein ABI729_03405 [Chitinophagales bacterium]